MIRRPPRSTLDRSSAASDVYKRQLQGRQVLLIGAGGAAAGVLGPLILAKPTGITVATVSYTHLRAHETVLDLVCRLLLEKKKNKLTTTES